MREWIERGWLMGQEEYEKTIYATTLDQVKRIIPKFLGGASVVVDTLERPLPAGRARAQEPARCGRYKITTSLK